MLKGGSHKTHDHMIPFVWYYRKAKTTDQWLPGARGKGLTAQEPKRTFWGNRNVLYLNYHEFPNYIPL